MIRRPALSTSLKTDRCVLRPPASKDVGRLRAALRKNHAHLEAWNPLAAPGATTITVLSEKIAQWRSEWRRDLGYRFFVFDGAEGPLIGGVSLTGVNRGPLNGAYLGYWIDAEYEGKGYVSDAVRKVLSFGFERVELHRIQAAIMPRNERSVRVAERLRFRREGLAVRYLCIRGVWEDHEIFALTREEWPKMSQPPE